MVGIVEFAQIVALAVAGQGILGQVIGADGEKVHFLCQCVCHKNRGRCLKHNADFRVLIIGNAFFVQLCHHLLAGPLAFFYLPDGGDHGEHDCDFAKGGGTVQRPELGLEDLRAIQADADGTDTKGRIFFLFHIEIVHLLVSADIQGADDNPLHVHRRGNGLIGLELFFLGGIVRSCQIQKFTAEQADSLTVIGKNRRHIIRRTDVAVDIDFPAIQGDILLPLAVSCIMIGIVTYISVIERTKEIGVLRALGASKKNISQVFNAETFIIGICSGAIGVGVSALITIPVNAILGKILGAGSVNVALPVESAVVLVVISIIVTVIGGLYPSKKAAKKDPVIALRTE